ncbi:MAG: universal stress protein [Gammaproteobacteria bacterium]|nr:MAG: universal stress protein [Gammaproteobacteria bacterium]
MGIKTILVPIDGSKNSFAALERAFVVANRFGSHIKALHVMLPPTDGTATGFYNLPANLRKSAESEAEKAAIQKAEELQEQFETYCSDHNIPISKRPTRQGGPSAVWKQEFGYVDDVLIHHGLVSDVIAVSRPTIRKGTLRREPLGRAIEAILLRTGRPVLINPPKSVAKKYTRVAIGWNDSIECSRALAMTMPWLVEMDEITVLITKDRESSVKTLIEYLAWHNVKADIALLDDKGEWVGEALLNVSNEIDAEFLIVGGFSHTRAREVLFGGVTRHLLMNSNIVTIMVH